MDCELERRLWLAATDGNLEEVRQLASDPLVNVNWLDEELNRTALYRACGRGRTEVLEYLLSHPRVDPNLRQSQKATPLIVACFAGHTAVVSILLADPRIDPNALDSDQNSSLWKAAQEGHLGVVQVLLASGKGIETGVKSAFNGLTAADHGRQQPVVGLQHYEVQADVGRRHANGPLCASLIGEYERDPVAVSLRLRRLPGIREGYIGRTFALVIFVSDGFLVLREDEVPEETQRFFGVCARLPLDLQMALCNRMFGSPRNVVPSRDSETGFRWLARSTTWE